MNRSLPTFDTHRKDYGPPREPKRELIIYCDELVQMSVDNGLKFFTEGTAGQQEVCPQTPKISTQNLAERLLWAIRNDDVVYAEEDSEFGKTLNRGVIKHTNLTGGDRAFGGGELLIQNETTLIINGRSGRYRIRSSAEMDSVALAFKNSGYHVWTMGYDEEADFPSPFIGIDPQWVE